MSETDKALMLLVGFFLCGIAPAHGRGTPRTVEPIVGSLDGGE